MSSGAPDYSSLMTRATSEVGHETSAQTDPLEGRIGALRSGEDSAVGQIQSTFGQILPFSADAAQRLEAYTHSALAMEQQIFQAAGDRLNKLSQSRAASAQALAQQMGGPVATNEFTAGVEPSLQAFPNEQAGELLHSLNLGQSEVAYAEAFPNRIFPAQEVELTTHAKHAMDQQIADIQDRIDQLNASKAGTINDRYNQYVQKQQEYELNQKQLQLDRLKSDRDWRSTQHTLKNDDRRVALAQRDARLRATQLKADINYKKRLGQIAEGQLTGTYKGKPTQAAIKLSNEESLKVQKLGLDSRKYALSLGKFLETTKIQKQRLTNQLGHNVMGAIDQAVSPTKGKPVTQTVRTFIPKGSTQEAGLITAAVTGKVPHDTHYDPKRKQWYTYSNVTLSPQEWAAQGGYKGATPVSDPQRLFDLVRGSYPNFPKPALVRLVNQKLGLKDWTPGVKGNYTADELHTIGKQSFSELRGIALNKGWNPPKKRNATVQMLVDFILSRNGK
jgi:adenylate cyclase class IV